MYALRTAINRSHMEGRPSRSRVYPIDDSSRNHALVLSLRPIGGQAMRKRIYIIRRCGEVDKPREQRVMGRGRFCGCPCPRGGRVRWFVLYVRDGDLGYFVARGGTQPGDLRERATDHFQVRIDGWRGSDVWRASELAAQRCAHHAAHLFGGEFGLGEQVAELRQRALPKKKGRMNHDTPSLFLFLPLRATRMDAYLGRHVATWDYARLKERAAR